jgi:hypothetical protein
VFVKELLPNGLTLVVHSSPTQRRFPVHATSRPFPWGFEFYLFDTSGKIWFAPTLSDGVRYLYSYQLPDYSTAQHYLQSLQPASGYNVDGLIGGELFNFNLRSLGALSKEVAP